MNYFLIGLGSNISPHDNIPKAQQCISEHSQILYLSPVLENPACGESFHADFHNQLLVACSEESEQVIKAKFEIIELQLGREEKTPARKFKDRTIDIDILYCGKSLKDCASAPLEDSYNRRIMIDWKLASLI